MRVYNLVLGRTVDVDSHQGMRTEKRCVKGNKNLVTVLMGSSCPKG